MSAIVDKFGLPVDVALVAAMFVALFGSMMVPALYSVALVVIAVMSVVTALQVVTIMRSE